MNLSWQYRLMNDLNTSEKYGRMAVEQAQADNDRHAIIEANTNLGETLLAQNKIEEAEVFYTSGLELSKQKNDRDKFVFEVYYSTISLGNRGI
jgi:catechol-2,3-dioxygenase